MFRSFLYVNRNRQSTFSPLKPYIPLPKYFGSEWSYAQYRIPSQASHISISAPPSKAPTEDVVDEERCVVAWIQVPVEPQSLSPDAKPGAREERVEHQLIALTYTGGWYRLALPSSSSVTTTIPSSTPSYSPSIAPSPLPVSRTSPALSGSPPSARAMSGVRPRSGSGESFGSRTEKGKERERDREREAETKGGRECTLREFRKYGRWDGWG